VLFSEPKIPQNDVPPSLLVPYARFSALQRAENSSEFRFQAVAGDSLTSFSALQRAENSSE